MKSLLTKFRPAHDKSRFTWAPATEMTSGWMICVLNPFGTSS